MFASDIGQCGSLSCPGVVPVLVGPLQVLLTVLPGLLLAFMGGIFALFKPSGIKNLARLLWRQKLAVILLGLIVGGGFYGYRAVGSGRTGITREAEQGTNWPTARFDLNRTGAVPGTPSPTIPKLIWSFKEGNEGFLSSPAVVGNRVYVASARLGAFSKSGQIFCFDADTGAVVWANAPEGYRPTFSSPVVVGDFLVCGEGLHDTRDARVICLDIRPEKKGEVLWTFETKNHVECTPVVAGDRVFFGAGDDGIYCLDLKTGKEVWHLPPEQYPDAETSLAVYKDKVYAGLGNEGQALCVLNAATGKELHREKMPYPVFSPPAIANGKIYLGMGKGDYVNSGEMGEVRCLNLNTLKTEWIYPLDQTVLGAVAVTRDNLYFGCKDGYLYSLTPGGKLAGKVNVHAPIVTSPAVTDKAVYVVSDAGLLLAVDRNTLDPLWEFRLGTEPFFISSPVVARGHVYVGTQNDGLLCVGEPGKKNKTPLWANPLGGPGRAGNIDNSPIPPQLMEYWRFPNEDGSKKDRPLVPTSVACLGDDVLVPFTQGSRTGIACLSRKSKPGTEPKPRWVYETSDPVARSPVILNNLVLFLVPGNLVCLDRASGKLRWTKPVADNVSGILTVTSQQILVQDERHLLTCLDGEGQQLWSSLIPGLERIPTASPNLILATASARAGNGGYVPGILSPFGETLALDRESGAILWRAPLDHVPRTTPILGKIDFFLSTEGGLKAYSQLNGQPLPDEAGPAGPSSTEFAVRNRDIFFVNASGELIVADRETGKPKIRVGGALPGIPPLVSRGQVVVATAKGLALVQFDQENPQLEPFSATEAFGPPIAPMVLHDSRLYVPTRDHGLVCFGREK